MKKHVPAGWNTWRKVSDRCVIRVSARMKGKVYKTVVRSMSYDFETVALRTRREAEEKTGGTG